ncbi:MAG: hypothetical protein IJ153_01860 [Clostridia bacterium]|nr:hypothetical protein [Clostridia bacterium]
MTPIMNATDVRKEWSTVVDNTVRVKPQFFKRTRDLLFLSDLSFVEDLLSGYTYTAIRMDEEDGSVTLALNELDLAENGKDENDARLKLASSILEYSEDFYNDFSYWASAPNRKTHIPYVFKALSIRDTQKIGDSIKCQAGRI